MDKIEYLVYFSGGPINVTVKFEKGQGSVANRTTSATQIGEFIQWLQDHPATPVYFDDHPYLVPRIEFIANRNALVLHAKMHSENPRAD